MRDQLGGASTPGIGGVGLSLTAFALSFLNPPFLIIAVMAAVGIGLIAYAVVIWFKGERDVSEPIGTVGIDSDDTRYGRAKIRIKNQETAIKDKRSDFGDSDIDVR